MYAGSYRCCLSIFLCKNITLSLEYTVINIADMSFAFNNVAAVHCKHIANAEMKSRKLNYIYVLYIPGWSALRFSVILNVTTPSYQLESCRRIVDCRENRSFGLKMQKSAQTAAWRISAIQIYSKVYTQTNEISSSLFFDLGYLVTLSWLNIESKTNMYICFGVLGQNL